jgi:hypothetical protein
MDQQDRLDALLKAHHTLKQVYSKLFREGMGAKDNELKLIADMVMGVEKAISWYIYRRFNHDTEE